jgi:hypothetical protein
MFRIDYQPISDDSTHNQSSATTSNSRVNDVTDDVEMTNSVGHGGSMSSSVLNNHNIDDGSLLVPKSVQTMGFALISIASLVLAYSFMSSISDTSLLGEVATNQSFDEFGRFVMTNFDSRKPMSNFLAGVGGLWGVPMWLFYVNRGQGVQSFGTANKDGGIAAFQTAEKAYQETALTGFRTFLKGERPNSKECWKYQPFMPDPSDKKVERDMKIGMNEFEIEERNNELGLQTNILYYTSSFEDFPALIRKTTFTNTDSSQPLEIEVLDGLAKLIPHGLTSVSIAAMGRTLEAWMKVYNVGNGKGDKTHPFFRITQGTADTSTVQLIKEGHFAVSYINDDSISGAEYPALPFILDPSIVFDSDTSYLNPKGFFGAEDFETFIKQDQGVTARTPCAYAAAKLVIPAGKSITMTTVLGHSPDLETFVGTIDKKIRAKDFSSTMRTNSNKLVDDLTQRVSSNTNYKIFDDYVKQDMLDNVLRGGLPLQLGKDEKKTFHVYSRIHGDIERDYNNFLIDTTYYSQGPGNFRDVNQNRRTDSLHSPEIGDFNIRNFLSFVQYDGYNPLTVASTNFKIKDKHLPDVLKLLGIDEMEENVKWILTNSYRPGQLFRDLQNIGFDFKNNEMKQEILDQIMDYSEQVFAAAFAQNGFWSDHWSYTLDMVDTYLMVYPDKEVEMLWESEPVPFYFSPAIVKPRSERYVLHDDPSSPGKKTIQVTMAIADATDPDFPPNLMNQMNHIWSAKGYVGDGVAGGTWQRDEGDNVMEVTVVSKLAMLGILKFATLDPMGMGVEYEGGKPGWNDAMNGLSGLLGSGMPETYESYRIISYVKKALEAYGRSIVFPTEFSELLDDLKVAISDFASSDKDEAADYKYWDATNNAREKYRKKLYITFSGKTTEISASNMISTITSMEKKFDVGIKKAIAMTEGKVSPAYFYYECTDYTEVPVEASSSSRKLQMTTDDAPPTPKVIANKFRTHQVPLFLEGPVRNMKILKSKEEKKKVYERVKSSGLYDKELEMYTVSASLKEMGPGLGRMIAFSPGWLENQSVWLHMSYKWYLELLRGELYEEFYEEIKTGLVPFMDQDVYGRSPLEAASFIVSSAFPDKKLHGASFLARLSGSTAEFLSMWAEMFFGHQPFIMKDNKLVLQLKPALADHFFKEDGTAGFTLLGAIAVTYHNDQFINTWEGSITKIVMTSTSGEKTIVYDSVLTGVDAEKVRRKDVTSIDAYY